ncbi:MAG: MarR family winged helix-turn-helix transcriptional regulator [Hyphomicrobiaceae bacterium]|nr:MarR family winged helix-turn-helix transcriptional regulator [Hyphomicrobiaceae bacterium]
MASPSQASETWPPLTVTRRGLLVAGSDGGFRRLIEDMVVFAQRLGAIREGLAAHMQVSPPQFKIIMALARAETPEMTATQLAARLGVSMPFITTETAKLMRLGLLKRRRNPRDARSSLFELTAAARQRVRDAAPLVREVNDRLFGLIGRSEMEQLAGLTTALLSGSDHALAALQAGGKSEDAANGRRGAAVRARRKEEAGKSLGR